MNDLLGQIYLARQLGIMNGCEDLAINLFKFLCIPRKNRLATPI